MAYASVNELAAALRITVTAENTAALQSCLDAAALEIDHAMARREIAASVGDWLFSEATQTADPGDGRLRLDRPTAAAATAVYIDTLDADGSDRQAGLAALTTDHRFRLQVGAAFESFTMTGAAVDHGGWFELPAASDGSGGLDLYDGRRLTVATLEVTPLVTQQLALANRVNLLRGVEWWKSNDAAFGVIGFDQVGALQVPRNGFRRHAAALTPLKQQWGIG